MDFNQYITENYNELLRIATAIYINTQLDPAEIISELYLDARDREIRPTAKDYRYYCIRWLSNARYWKGGNPVKKLYIRDNLSDERKERLTELLHRPAVHGSEIVKDLQNTGFTLDQA